MPGLPSFLQPARKMRENLPVPPRSRLPTCSAPAIRGVYTSPHKARAQNGFRSYGSSCIQAQMGPARLGNAWAHEADPMGVLGPRPIWAEPILGTRFSWRGTPRLPSSREATHIRRREAGQQSERDIYLFVFWQRPSPMHVE